MIDLILLCMVVLIDHKIGVGGVIFSYFASAEYFIGGWYGAVLTVIAGAAALFSKSR